MIIEILIRSLSIVQSEKNAIDGKSWVDIVIYAWHILLNLFVCLFVWFDSLRPLNNLSVMRDGSSWVEPVLS